MKRIKKLLIMSLLLITTGCSVEYNLTINRDSSVSERVISTENTRRLKNNTGLDEETGVKYLYEMFDRPGLSTKMSYVTKNGETIATVTGNHRTLEDYANNFSSDVFNRVNVIEDGDNVTLEFEQSVKLGKDTSRSLVYDELIINIDVPFKVLDHNADEKNYSVYTWKIKPGKELRTLSITYDKNNFRDEQKISIGDFSFSVKYQYIALTILGLIVLTIIIIVVINNKKNNKV